MSNRGRWVVILVAVGAALVGFMVAGLVGVRVNDPVVQGAAVGAFAGVVGGVLGAAITAWTTHKATQDTVAEARAAREASVRTAHEAREDAQRAMFADRMLTLASQLIEDADNYVMAVRTLITSEGKSSINPSLYRNALHGGAAEQLIMMVASPASYEAIKKLRQVALYMDDLDLIGPARMGKLDKAISAYRAAVGFFEDAIRQELGRPAVYLPTEEAPS